jgi:hypothetical protein
MTLTLQKKIVRIMAGAKLRNSCTSVIKREIRDFNSFMWIHIFINEPHCK